MWRVTEDDLEALAVGAGILGTGGGGNPYLGKLRTRELLRQGLSVEVVTVDELPSDALVACCTNMGSPTVGIEKIQGGREGLDALRALEAHTGRRVTALISGEVGGANVTTPMIVGAQAGLPVVDGDGMGRAFPELQMKSFLIEGVSGTPAALCDEKANATVIAHAVDARTLERIARAVTIQYGARATVVSTLMSRDEVRRTAVLGTITEARAIGRAVLMARREHADPAEAVLRVRGGRRAFAGRIVDVERRLEGGFARGRVVLEGLDAWRGHEMEVRFQNENLVAFLDRACVLAVPDLICLIEAESGEPVTTELLRFGLRVHVLGLPAPARMATPRALAVVGPAAFGYGEVDFAAVRLAPTRAC